MTQSAAEQSAGDTWQEEWRFNLDQESVESKAKIRGYLQFGGRLSLHEHFLPRAAEVCEERGLRLLRTDRFVALVDFNRNHYVVSACVTLQRKPSDERTTARG